MPKELPTQIYEFITKQFAISEAGISELIGVEGWGFKDKDSGVDYFIMTEDDMYEFLMTERLYDAFRGDLHRLYKNYDFSFIDINWDKFRDFVNKLVSEKVNELSWIKAVKLANKYGINSKDIDDFIKRVKEYELSGKKNKQRFKELDMEFEDVIKPQIIENLSEIIFNESKNEFKKLKKVKILDNEPLDLDDLLDAGLLIPDSLEDIIVELLSVEPISKFVNIVKEFDIDGKKYLLFNWAKLIFESNEEIGNEV
jgi:hypothetical protein